MQDIEDQVIAGSDSYQSVLAEKSGPTAWKQLPTWYQASEAGRVIPPDLQRKFVEQNDMIILDLASAAICSLTNSLFFSLIHFCSV
jgi:hypothetical protein